MTVEVLCPRPRADFERADARPPASLDVVYRAPADGDLPALMKRAKALVIPALLALEGEAACRVLFTPHIAGVTRQSAALLYRAAWRNVHRVTVENQPPLNRVY